MTISNRGSIKIGRDCLVSWNTWICDSDFHQIVDLETGRISKPNGSVCIGDHVWICSNSSVVKGAVIPNGCIMGTGSLSNKIYHEENCLLAGIPATVKKHQISWKK